MSVVQPYEVLLSQLEQRPRRYEALLVAVDGCGASGKSTFARALENLDSTIAIVHMDDFYLPQAQRPSYSSAIASDFDTDRFASEVLLPLTQNQAAHYRRYDWGADQLAEFRTVPPQGIVILEGVYTLLPQFAPLYDFRIWVDCPYDTRLARGLARDGEAARDLWVNRWMPAETRYIETFAPAEHANLVVNGSNVTSSEQEFTVLQFQD